MGSYDGYFWAAADGTINFETFLILDAFSAGDKAVSDVTRH